LKPLERVDTPHHRARVAFTPKGGCPLKPSERRVMYFIFCVAFTPKGGCPLKQLSAFGLELQHVYLVAFTPKGGCPLKPAI